MKLYPVLIKTGHTNIQNNIPIKILKFLPSLFM